MKISRSMMSSPPTLAILRYGAIPLTWGLGGLVAVAFHLGMLMRGRRGHLASALAIAGCSGISFLWHAISSESHGMLRNPVLAKAALLTALAATVSYMAGLALRTAWTRRGDHRQAVVLSAGAITVLALVVNLARIPVQEARVELAKSETEQRTAAIATAFVEAIALGAEENGQRADPETLKSVHDSLLSTGIIRAFVLNASVNR